MDPADTALLRAAAAGDIAEVQRVLAGGASPAAVDGSGRSALWHAAFHSGDVVTIEALLEAGAPPTLADTAGYLPIHAAAAKGHCAAVRLLASAAPATAAAVTAAGLTPLHCACQAGADPEAVEPLLQAAPQAAGMRSNQGQLPIHLAATALQGGAAIQLLLQAAPQTVAARNSLGSTALHYAAWSGNVAAVQALLAANPCCACVRDSMHELPLADALQALGREISQHAHGNASARQGVRRYCEIALDLVEAMPPALSIPVASKPQLQHDCLPLFPIIIACHALTEAEWQALPSPCPGLAAALPAVVNRSAAEAALLVARLPAADRLRLRTFALCLARTQRQLGLELPAPLVGRILSLFDAA